MAQIGSYNSPIKIDEENNVTTTTQSNGDSSTRIATTEYVGSSLDSLTKSNSVQTITGSTSSASIGADVNVVYNNSTSTLTLTVETTTNVANIGFVNNGSSDMTIQAGAGVTITNVGEHTGNLSPGGNGQLIKISDNNWVFIISIS